MPDLDCDLGFELRTSVLINPEKVAVEAGDELVVHLAGGACFTVTVTKASMVNGRKQLALVTPLIMRIEKA